MSDTEDLIEFVPDAPEPVALREILARVLETQEDDAGVEYWENLILTSITLLQSSIESLCEPTEWADFISEVQRSAAARKSKRKRETKEKLVSPGEVDLTFELRRRILLLIDEQRAGNARIGAMRCDTNAPTKTPGRTGPRMVLPDLSFFNLDAKRQFPIEAKLFRTEREAPADYFDDDGLGCFIRVDGRYTEHRVAGMVAYSMSQTVQHWIQAIYVKLGADPARFGTCGTMCISPDHPPTLYSATPRAKSWNAAESENILLGHWVFRFPDCPDTRSSADE